MAVLTQITTIISRIEEAAYVVHKMWGRWLSSLSLRKRVNIAKMLSYNGCDFESNALNAPGYKITVKAQDKRKQRQTISILLVRHWFSLKNFKEPNT